MAASRSANAARSNAAAAWTKTSQRPKRRRTSAAAALVDSSTLRSAETSPARSITTARCPEETRPSTIADPIAPAPPVTTATRCAERSLGAVTACPRPRLPSTLPSPARGRRGEAAPPRSHADGALPLLRCSPSRSLLRVHVTGSPDFSCPGQLNPLGRGFIPCGGSRAQRRRGSHPRYGLHRSFLEQLS